MKETAVIVLGEKQEKIYLAKTENIWGWRIVHPIKNDDGSINWMNLLFGGKGNLATLILILFVAFVLYVGFADIMVQYKNIFESTCVQNAIMLCNQNFFPQHY